MKNKKLLLVSLIVILILVLFGLLDQKTSVTITNPQYVMFTKDQEVNFAAFDQVEFNLSKQHLIDREGVYHITGSSLEPLVIDTTGKVKIILDGVSIHSSTGPAIYIPNASFVTIEIVNENELIDGSHYEGYDEEVNGTIYSKDDLVFMGNGTLTIHSNYQDAIVSKDHLKFYSGTYQITANDDGIRGSDSIYIVDGKYSIEANGDGMKSTKENDETKGYIMIENGEFTITCENDGIQSENALLIYGGSFHITTHEGAKESQSQMPYSTKTSDEESHKGFKANQILQIEQGDFIFNCDDDSIHSNDSIEINGGHFSISTSDDGIHADLSLVINEGEINIQQSYEGLEASQITINQGNINLVSSDDGINASTKSETETTSFNPGTFKKDQSLITINNGIISINASGDGIDSNGDLIINGGKIIVNGPTDNSNSAIDFNGDCIINGGELLAIGSSGMVERISENSQLNVMMITVETSISNIVIKEGNEELINYTPIKKYSSIIYSSSKLQKEHSYDLYLDDTLTLSLEVTNTITSNQMNSLNQPFDHPSSFPQEGMRPNENQPTPFHDKNMPMPERNEDGQNSKPKEGFENKQRPQQNFNNY